MKFWRNKLLFFRKYSVFSHLSIVLLSLSAFIYFLKAKIFLDPDFGWALRLGELILKNGIPKTDPFSYTMPSYPYVDYEWFTHVGMAKLYAFSGYTVLALIFTLLAIITILICVRNSDARFIPLQILFASATLFSYFGVRSQVITWLFFAVVSKTVLDEVWWKRLKYFMPVLFLLWANMHGGFIAGLIVLFAATIQRRNIKDVVILLFSILITLLNPYGLRLWKEVWISTTDFPIRFYIIEWRPIFFSITAVALISIAYFSAFIVQYRKKYKAYEILIFVLMFMAAFSSSRNIPLFVIYALILMKKGIGSFMLEIGNNRQKLFRFRLAYAFFFSIVSVLAFLQVKGDYLAAKTRSEDEYYPRQAINYLSRNIPKGQIYSSYEWGGYLDWKFPQKKVFIDGRMASWRQIPNNLEAGYVFGENNSLLLLKLSLPKVFKKYHIDTVLLPRAWLVERKRDTTWEVASKFVKALKKNKFREVYQDQVAIVYFQEEK
ncbi:hypothetical protein A3A46_03770 [Candidatus Roizmanbacteria bacterium RIFCSPLOWO2_01_FULL_37_13]|uniref:Glycosyltransferase RgtA/B/C/D-like domain-containing protein n=1 Tax=Candidatus Roizmanbacteria bacterium RIFCSPHIGHO2_02_FULL_38_11 TaxID=1802039 RepID=A0A1F7H300_9BACT|nr:MAG: hypothetical protein A3C25_00550 [Candidatus Roizmanbacteria bacterium RIFCSPHIGHO2_02_FULL_38_11]OGK33518.1 MAG: hypothetical protein A3F58_01810 [Candidatus Roizmanbacteria bacterium RIFCSPHIGHO2_12_FULL_37_9b]OGK41041.1 MAG: hypothetical protein A3A46_03770 [Candidatus Roizmanbacteria bacterium RIFCSPLOWO2_01_FULL_37_13]